MKKLLIIGGSWFLGRAVADEALRRGWHVDAFRRGTSGQDVEGVRALRGDRTDPEDLRRLAAMGPWDAVVDTAGYIPRDVLATARVLEPVAERYVFVSTVSVYRRWPNEPLTEDSELLDCPADAGPGYGYNEEGGPNTYAFGKVGSERAVLSAFGADRSVLLRSGIILGPREYVKRLPWWLRRVDRGGRVLAPGAPTRRIQPIDVRDSAAFAVHVAAGGPTGAFNLTGSGAETMSDLLAACRTVTGSEAEFEWIHDEGWLLAQGIEPWIELPLWRTYPGAWTVDASRAVAAGLSHRSLLETASATWDWMTSGEQGHVREDFADRGLQPGKEQSVLHDWDRRSSEPVLT